MNMPKEESSRFLGDERMRSRRRRGCGRWEGGGAEGGEGR